MRRLHILWYHIFPRHQGAYFHPPRVLCAFGNISSNLFDVLYRSAPSAQRPICCYHVCISSEHSAARRGVYLSRSIGRSKLPFLITFLVLRFSQKNMIPKSILWNKRTRSYLFGVEFLAGAQQQVPPAGKNKEGRRKHKDVITCKRIYFYLFIGWYAIFLFRVKYIRYLSSRTTWKCWGPCLHFSPENDNTSSYRSHVFGKHFRVFGKKREEVNLCLIGLSFALLLQASGC